MSQGGVLDDASTTPVGPGRFPITPYVVGPVGQAGYQTIQSAINVANAAGGGIVGVQPGTYTENLILFDKCHVMGLDFADAGGGVSLIGIHTPPSSGGFVFNNIDLQSATHIFNSAVAGSAHLIIANAHLTVVNGYTFNVPNWTGKLEVFDVNDRASTNDGFVNNTAGSEVAIFTAAVGAGAGNTMIVSGLTSIFGCSIGAPLNCVTGSNVFLEEVVCLNTVTFSNNSTGEITLSEVDAQIVMNSTGAVLISTTLINTASNPAISGTGAGVLTLGCVDFINNENISGTLVVSTSAANYFGEVRAGADSGGATGFTSLTKASTTTISTGTGTVKMSSANSANNTAWIKIYIGTTAYWIPAWTTNAP
jgi:hypothetical protein